MNETQPVKICEGGVLPAIDIRTYGIRPSYVSVPNILNVTFQ